MKQLFKIAKRISLFILAISVFGCVNDDEALPVVEASFTHTINAVTGTVTFINTSTEVRNYLWTFDDGTTSTEINPVHTFATGEYTVILKITNVAGATDTFEDIIVISDVGAPIITILGDTTINVRVGGTFTDPGATATDDGDGDVTANIIVAGDVVDVNKAGTYIITYNVSDAAGNAATQRTRTVIVANDTVAPVITLNGNATMNVAVGGTFTDPGATATDDTDGNITSSIIVGGDTVNANTAGTYTITYNVKDTAGNAATQVTRTVIVAVAGACTAEATESMSATNLNVTFKTDQTANIRNDNATFQYVANPDSNNTVNSSCFVGKVTKGKINPWDNNQIDFTSKFDLTANGGFKIKVFSAQPGFTVLVKLESIADPGVNTEIDLTTTKTNAWEELTFNFSSSHTNKYDRIVLIFDLTKAASNNVYYFDDLKLFARTSGGGSSDAFTLAKTIDFETTGFGANWTWNVFENVDNPPLEFVTNPSATGINTSSKVAKITARKAGAPWVGTETVHGQMGITWDLSASNAKIKIMVYKTVISDVGIKLVNPSGGAQGEIKVANTKINQWEELTFDFSSRIGNGLDGSTNIDQIVVFPDFRDPRTEETVTYFDNITFN